MIENDEAKGRMQWAMCLFHIAPPEGRAESGACGFRCSASNRGDGCSLYDRDYMYTDEDAVDGQASRRLASVI